MTCIARYLVVVLASLGIVAPALSQAPNRNIRFGMPAEAKADPAEKQAFLIERPQYVISYNDKTKTPNWVSWQLTKSDIGTTPRGSFEPDEKGLPDPFKRVTSGTYNGSGFDRGHMCNSADRSSSEENNDATFLMTNIIPQAPNNNQKAWERLETYCRDLAKAGNELYIVAGPFGIGGTGKQGFKSTIGPAGMKVTVPSHTWKVILVLPNKQAEPGRRTRTIAVWLPNDQTVNEDWAQFRVSINDVEEHTGFNFFPKIDGKVASIIKDQVDNEPISAKPAGKKKKKKSAE
ncbi:MAG TPA: DNA/RNA non-specific endonuclease [Gemmataceae bacterium]|nr:DNA/RNA non-specific endonuclease [Gemmataceae bacterium]